MKKIPQREILIKTIILQIIIAHISLLFLFLLLASFAIIDNFIKFFLTTLPPFVGIIFHFLFFWGILALFFIPFFYLLKTLLLPWPKWVYWGIFLFLAIFSLGIILFSSFQLLLLYLYWLLTFTLPVSLSVLFAIKLIKKSKFKKEGFLVPLIAGFLTFLLVMLFLFSPLWQRL